MTKNHYYLPTFAALLLRRRPSDVHAPEIDDRAPLAFTALAAGLFIVLASGRSLKVKAKDTSRVRGIFYARHLLIRDGQAYPAPQAGDLIAVRADARIISGYEVIQAGGEAPVSNDRTPDALLHDELIAQLRPDLGSLADWVAGADDPATVADYLKRGST